MKPSTDWKGVRWDAVEELCNNTESAYFTPSAFRLSFIPTR